MQLGITDQRLKFSVHELCRMRSHCKQITRLYCGNSHVDYFSHFIFHLSYKLYILAWFHGMVRAMMHPLRLEYCNN